MDEFFGDGLEDETIFFLEKGDLSAFADGIFFAEASRNDQLAFGSDGGGFSFHGDRSMTHSAE